ncbi:MULTISPECIES: undecaprenyl-diphosphatase [unclassified Duganella]|uniref:undecaprenyl-diphosphatase n=1 Tax=unclassified Duganella TaxID=2636909 RepID=UPI000E348615|nr:MULTISPECIES: undecaprenyl-diphosphatase [unclassified Duganella]RFP19221.1 undecaprenyl-diphosphatase [Duganella sp. BJB475]RFP35802.1 undecaprenyl-diphosphatase [Duganella sp. BJB476]
MNTLNTELFLMLAAPPAPAPQILTLAIALAEWAILAVPLLLVAGWLRGRSDWRKAALESCVAAAIALALAQGAGMLWPHPRPFMAGIAHAWVDHAADASFPSDHLTLLWSVALSLCLHPATRRSGTLLALLGVPIAWARIYIGVHYPADMAGALLIGAVGALTARRFGALPELFYPPAERLYRSVFRPLIQRGWVRD